MAFLVLHIVRLFRFIVRQRSLQWLCRRVDVVILVRVAVPWIRRVADRLDLLLGLGRYVGQRFQQALFATLVLICLEGQQLLVLLVEAFVNLVVAVAAGARRALQLDNGRLPQQHATVQC